MDIKALAAEFPRDAVHWRAQKLTRNKDKALALAYLDARDVMDRLDDVCGPENWQDEYVETPRGRIICRIGVRMDAGDWVWKSDGAGETAVEGDKGGISDAFKRAAVHWGIGRYLYRLDDVYAPCEIFNDKWSKWIGSPWDSVRGGKPKPPAPPIPFDAKQTRDRIKAAIANAADETKLEALWNHAATKEAVSKLTDAMREELQHAYTNRMGEVAA